MKFAVIALLAVGAAGIAGCEVYVRPHPVEVEATAPVVYDSFYIGGHYDGAFWIWHDHDGHEFRERREFHERRVVDREHRGIERHEEHHEERR